MNRSGQRILAALAASGLLLLAGAPAVAAGTVSQATASAITLTVAGSGGGSGTYTAKNDGTRQTTSGNNRPKIGVLGGQTLLQAGTLNQDASATAVNRQGHSAACAGVAGDGATLVAVGDTSCLRPGRNLSLDAGHVDLSHLTITDGTVTDGLNGPVAQAVKPVLSQVTPALSAGLKQALTSMGSPAVSATIGVIQARCTAQPGSASGSSELANVNVVATLPGQGPITLASLPVSPAPNTRVAADLGKIAKAVEDALKTQLTDALKGALGPAGAAIDQAAVINNVLQNIGKQLAPLTNQIITGVLNEQSHPTSDSIDVRAVHLVIGQGLVAAGIKPIDLSIGHVTCGPNGTVAAPAKHVHHSVPTVIDSGESGTGHGGTWLVLGAIVLVAAASAGVATKRG